MKYSEAYNIPKGALIGLFLGECVKDICRGLYELDDVACIVAGTRCPTDDDMISVILSYQHYSWREFPNQAADIALELWISGRIAQPRVDTGDVCSVDASDGGHWTRDLLSCTVS